MRPILAAVAVAVLLATPAAGARAPNLGRIRAGLAELAARGRLSGTVLIAKNGRPVFEHAYGAADRSSHTPNRLATRFNLASVGKTFTGVAVAQLVQAGKLRFQDRVGKYVPELRKDVGDRVTIAELLDHTSGLGDFFGDPGYERLRPRLTSLASYLPLIAEERLQFEPGARFGYSNSGYVLLGLVVERVSGESYYSYVAQHVFRPAGMTATGCFWKSRRVPNRADNPVSCRCIAPYRHHKTFSDCLTAWQLDRRGGLPLRQARAVPVPRPRARPRAGPRAVPRREADPARPADL